MNGEIWWVGLIPWYHDLGPRSGQHTSQFFIFPYSDVVFQMFFSGDSWLTNGPHGMCSTELTLKKPPFTPPAAWKNGWCFSTLRRDCFMAPKIPIHLSNETKTGCLGCIGYEILPSYMGIIMNHYKDPYKPTRISMESNKGFFLLLIWHCLVGGSQALNQVF